MSSQPKTILVIAGNYRQFIEWCHKNSRSPYDRWVRYINREHQLMGYDAPQVEVEYYGTWHDSPLFRGRNKLEPGRNEMIRARLRYLEQDDD